MALFSALFQGDKRLEEASLLDSAHIVPGDKGPHVAKIQAALNSLDNASLECDGSYGPRTANAVLAYKRKRNIINRSYQQSADNIVGRMTIAALDKELAGQAKLKPLEIIVLGVRPSLSRGASLQHPIHRLTLVNNPGLTNVAAANLEVPIGFDRLKNVPTANLQMPIGFARLNPGEIKKVICNQTAGFASAVCINFPDPSYNPPKQVRGKAVFLSNLNAPSNRNASLNPEDGGQVMLTNDPHEMRLETLRPGDAIIKVSRPDMSRVLLIDVRQDRKGPVPGAPLTKFTAGSGFFSASREEGGEGIDPANIFSGRPVNPKRGGRLINLGGEGETPEFEDYQVDLDHSLGGHGGFRPWTEDNDQTVFIPDKSASHITMRGTPLFDEFVKVINRIAQPGCHFTFSGDRKYESTIRSKIPGRQLETPKIELNNFIQLAWKIL